MSNADSNWDARGLFMLESMGLYFLYYSHNSSFQVGADCVPRPRACVVSGSSVKVKLHAWSAFQIEGSHY